MSNEIEVPGGSVKEKLTPEEISERTRAAVGYNYEYKDKYLVGREKIREFALATQATDPIHFEVEAARAAGYEDIVAPPIFFSLFGIIAHRPLFDEAVVGYGKGQIMQSEQKVVFHRPIVAGQVLTCHVHFDSFRQAVGVDMIVTRNEIHDQHGNHLCSSWTTLVGYSGGGEDDTAGPDFEDALEKVMMHGTA
ncbi:(3R)-hydroxyacyl-ACP dehydratase subunit HadA [Tsukamurella sp. 8F]|uniref:(3R)-hydroxyacyl-ACP dehydratase subunit HadA n=1 Tax=unclassified Tsukamurella TaxID=2633480 RepID=UPI0023B9E096|nr:MULTISPECIES: (3R)-hydroxyacyl-ACP dehydratase subunit HadA [unclassified Tsukamurella]MDF0531623.1 (3R)-hydroxyacyl-ACP dehydratase subunit HadA [Tsukamurella sp. 8J]MDF0588809.1 (3R)-hydroxyacyl-ACP dehydratase subunit HadA [Tsukamurella sp. 8F]